jgi:2-polyprenyl-3-methyl-5-hydroxy-6-metoxy-1,4-benzoquinol methylase
MSLPAPRTIAPARCEVRRLVLYGQGMPSSKYDVEIDLAQAPDTSHAYMVELVGSNKRVLDVGCATGYLAKALTAFGNVVSGVELDSAAADQARPWLDRVVIGDLEQLDLVAEFGEDAFDVVVFGDVLEHLRDPLRVLRQARPLLRLGGWVVLSVPNIAHGDVRLALLKGRFDYTKVGLLDDTHVRFFTRQSLGRFLRDGGFAAVEFRRTTAEMFSTEVGVRREDYDAALVEAVQTDPEALTYQFVVRAVRDDAIHLETAVLDRIDQLQLRVRELEGELSAAVAERDRLAGQADRLQDHERLAGELAEQRRLVAHYQAEIDALYQTTLMRLARIPRAAWARMRRASAAKGARGAGSDADTALG